MRKRIASALCAVLLALGCAVPAFAAEKTTYTIEEMNITLELPDDLYVLSSLTSIFSIRTRIWKKRALRIRRSSWR